MGAGVHLCTAGWLVHAGVFLSSTLPRVYRAGRQGLGVLAGSQCSGELASGNIHLYDDRESPTMIFHLYLPASLAVPPHHCIHVGFGFACDEAGVFTMATRGGARFKLGVLIFTG